jgi:hypothetical protein
LTDDEYSRGDKTPESKWEQLAARGKEDGSLVRERERERERHRGSAKKRAREKERAERGRDRGRKSGV